MASPPFSIAETTPQDANVVLNYPAAERTYRDVVESWLTLLSDPTTGKLKGSGVPAGVLTGHLNGLTMSNAAGDLSNDITVAVGTARDSTDVDMMYLASATTKQLDNAWVVGSGAGGLDTGVVGNNTYHMWLIKRPDTGVVDALFSLSVTAPTMPANYTLKRRIGSLVRIAAVNQRFIQVGDRFMLNAPFLELSVSNPGTAAVLGTLTTIPAGLELTALLTGYAIDSSPVASTTLYISSPLIAATAPGSSALTVQFGTSSGTIYFANFQIEIVVNTSRQIRYELTATSVDHDFLVLMHGWLDARGR